jgi:predicted alpha/beta hydrolase family esterase
MDLVHEQTTERPDAVFITVAGDPYESPARNPVASCIELDLSKFPNGRWALQLDEAFARRSAPAVILAHGVACLAVAWWAQLSPRSYLKSVQGAVFRSPLHVGFGQAPIAASASTGPTQSLPFASIVASEVTPYVEQVLALADRWGSRFVDIGARHASHPSNRSAVGSDREQALLAYLDLFDRTAGVEAALPVGPEIALLQPRG